MSSFATFLFWFGGVLNMLRGWSQADESIMALGLSLAILAMFDRVET